MYVEIVVVRFAMQNLRNVKLLHIVSTIIWQVHHMIVIMIWESVNV